MSYQPFPVEILPGPVARFVREISTVMGCDPGMVALPALSALAATIGTTRTIRLDDTWIEPSVVWTCVIARSGTLKSPAQEHALCPLEKAQAGRYAEYAAAMQAYEIAKLRHEKEMRVWKSKTKDSGDPPEAPEPPACVRHITDDATIEALFPIVKLNPRGILSAPDELTGWARSFGQYKGGRGADESHWLRIWSARSVTVDRKTGEYRTIRVPRMAVSVCGTIQPDVFAETMAAHFESGLAARLLVHRPFAKAAKRSRRRVSKTVCDSYTQVFHTLLNLNHAQGEHEPEPIELALNSTADAEVFTPWHDDLADRMNAAESDRDAAALAKVKGYAPRFALIFTLIENPGARAVGADALRRGCALADWFAVEALRVYGLMGEDEETRELRQLVDWIRRRGGVVTARDLTRALRAYPTAGEAESALEGLVKAGLGRREYVGHGVAGGRPVRRFILTESRADETPPENPADADRTLENPEETAVVSAVGSVGGDESANSVGAWGEV